jgi:hypothetical protein
MLMTKEVARTVLKASNKLAPSQRIVDVNLQLSESQLREIIDGAERVADAVMRDKKQRNCNENSIDGTLCEELKTQQPSAWGDVAKALRSQLAAKGAEAT